ncbi:hypothetical protein ACGFIX_19360 [Nocardia salmonicida]|uniref:hypothetical protein n=1 Tax=Nocardia salmonicida TaxID=53431 RepID=UPI003712C34F
MSEQGKTYSAFIEAELKAEHQRRATYDVRAQALVTSAGVLTTLLGGAVALIKTSATSELPSHVFLAAGITLLFLIAAAACGAVAGWNKPYTVLDKQALQKLSTDLWGDDEIDARNNVTDSLVDTLTSLRVGTSFKAQWVAYGLITQVVALFLLSVVVMLLAISSV